MGPRGRTFRTHRTRRLLSRMLSQASPGLARGRRIVGGSGLRASRTGLAGVNEATHCRLQIANSSAAGRAGLRESADAGRAALCGARYLLVAPNSELRAAGRKPFSAPAVRLPSRARTSIALQCVVNRPAPPVTKARSRGKARAAAAMRERARRRWRATRAGARNLLMQNRRRTGARSLLSLRRALRGGASVLTSPTWRLGQQISRRADEEL